MTFNDDINDFITIRENAAYDDIIDEPGFKKLCEEISGLEDSFLKLIPTENNETFHRFCELSAMRYGYIQDQVYKKGFADGFKLAKYISDIG